MSENENKIRVVLRTRPTPQFASKQLSLDTQENVKIFLVIKDDNNK